MNETTNIMSCPAPGYKPMCDFLRTDNKKLPKLHPTELMGKAAFSLQT
jgi:hypothetical protein